jgi:hypothetical protein
MFQPTGLAHVLKCNMPSYRTYEEVEMYVTATLSNVLEGQFGLE